MRFKSKKDFHPWQEIMITDSVENLNTKEKIAISYLKKHGSYMFSDSLAVGYFYDEEELKKSNHAWNAVNINGTWQLLDCTWGDLSSESKEFNLTHRNFYFCAKPELFIFTHFPENKKWQMLSEPINGITFLWLSYQDDIWGNEVTDPKKFTKIFNDKMHSLKEKKTCDNGYQKIY